MEVAALSGIARTQNADIDEGAEAQMSNLKVAISTFIFIFNPEPLF